MLRVLWLPSYARSVVVGREYTEEQLSEAGLNPKQMLEMGEVEDTASPKSKRRRSS